MYKNMKKSINFLVWYLLGALTVLVLIWLFKYQVCTFMMWQLLK